MWAAYVGGLRRSIDVVSSCDEANGDQPGRQPQTNCLSWGPHDARVFRGAGGSCSSFSRLPRAALGRVRPSALCSVLSRVAFGFLLSRARSSVIVNAECCCAVVFLWVSGLGAGLFSPSVSLCTPECEGVPAHRTMDQTRVPQCAVSPESQTFRIEPHGASLQTLTDQDGSLESGKSVHPTVQFLEAALVSVDPGSTWR